MVPIELRQAAAPSLRAQRLRLVELPEQVREQQQQQVTHPGQASEWQQAAVPLEQVRERRQLAAPPEQVRLQEGLAVDLRS